MIRAKSLPPDATLADVLPGLDDAEGYLRAVLATMRICQKHHGDAWVRIAVSARGIARGAAPSYRIDRPEPGPASPDATAKAEARAVFGAYGGRSHDRFTQVNTLETRWSTRALGMAETIGLRDALRRPRSDPSESTPRPPVEDAGHGDLG